MKKILILGICGLFCSCFFTYDPPRAEIQVVNNSNKGQIIYYTCSDMIGAEIDSFKNRAYERLAGCEIPILNEDIYIDKESYRSFGIRSKKKHARVCKDKHIRFFFISDSVFINTPWDTIVKYQMYNRKLVLSEEELKENDWTVIYE